MLYITRKNGAKLMGIISLFSLVHSRQSGISFSFFLPFLNFFLKETEIENHRQERDKHMEAKAKERIWQRAKRHKLHLTVISGVTWKHVC